MPRAAASSGVKRGLPNEAGDASPPRQLKRIQSTTTKSAVSNFFKPLSQKDPERTTWRVVHNTLLVGKYFNKDGANNRTKDGKPGAPFAEEKTKSKIAGFDLDSTLIITQSGNRHAKTESDWKWWHASVPGKLKSLHNEGYQIVIFTNQAGLKNPTKDSAVLKKFKLKAAAILDALDIPLTLYAATGQDRYRKPRTGMWDEMIDYYDLDVHGVDLSASYLVGDAAGREGDHSDSDRHWAMNIGISFHTPEEFFLNETPKLMSHRFDPSIYLSLDAATSSTSASSPTVVFSKRSDQELVIFVGSPGAGKSSFYRRHLKPLGFERVNQDTLKTKEKCLKAASEHLAEGKCVAVDNTNPDVETRAKWISLAKKHGVPIRCIYFAASAELCQHNDAVRAFGSELVNPEKRTPLPKMAFVTYFSRFKEPTKGEGFQDMVKVEFQWEGDDQERDIWRKFWI